MKTNGIHKVIDLVELSDAFRRHARFRSPETVGKLVREARKLARITANQRLELPPDPESLQMAQRSLNRIFTLAAELGADRVILPLAAEKPMHLNQAMLNQASGLVTLSFQEKPYAMDLSAVGPVDGRIRTVLDKDLLGMFRHDRRLHLNSFVIR